MHQQPQNPKASLWEATNGAHGNAPINDSAGYLQPVETVECEVVEVPTKQPKQAAPTTHVVIIDKTDNANEIVVTMPDIATYIVVGSVMVGLFYVVYTYRHEIVTVLYIVAMSGVVAVFVWLCRLVVSIPIAKKKQPNGGCENSNSSSSIKVETHVSTTVSIDR